jgi:capsular exopolysaccharide synthesis family protein
MDIRALLRALRRSWWVVVLVTLIGTGIGVFITVQTPPSYASTVTFFVKTPTSSTDSALSGDAFGQKRVNTYVQMMSSDRLAAEVASAAQVDLTPAQVVSRISARGDLNTVLLTATVTDSSPERSLALATALSTVFVKYVTDLETPPDADAPTVYLTVTAGPTLNPVSISPQPLLNIGLGALAGLVLGLGLAILRDILDTSIRSSEALRSVSQVPVLGVIAMDGSSKKTPLLVDRNPRSPRAEAFRQIRTNLQFVNVDSPLRVLVVTSPSEKEGKSSTAANLALTIAETGRKVLLIEGDLRRPQVAEYLGLEGSVGLTNVLAGQVDIREVLQPWGNGSLTVLPSGSIPANPSELLGSHSMKRLLESLKKSFDIIIIDTPPLLPVTDAAVTAVFADGAVVIVRHGKTTRHQLTTALRALDTVGAKILGTVLNMAPAKGIDTYASRSGGYYFKEDKSGRGTLDLPIESMSGARHQEDAIPATAGSSDGAGHSSSSTKNGGGSLVSTGHQEQALNGTGRSSSKRAGLRRPVS